MNWPIFRFNEEHFTFHLQYKYSGMFAKVNMKNWHRTPKNPKMCDPIVVTLLKMQPRYSQSSRESVTPSSRTSPLASYKEVPSPQDLTLDIHSSECLQLSRLRSVSLFLQI